MKSILPKQAALCRFDGVTPEILSDAAHSVTFAEIGASQPESHGFVRPFPEDAAVLHHVPGAALLAFRHDEKILPSSVVKAEVAARVTVIETNEARRVGRRELREIEELVRPELLAKAFVRSSITYATVDFTHQLLFVYATGTKVDRVIETLLRGFSSIEKNAADLQRGRANGSVIGMFSALILGEPVAGFSIDDRATFDYPEKGRIKISDVSAQNDEVQTLLKDSGCHCTELALTWNDRLSFTLDPQLQMKRIDFLGIDQINEQQDDLLPEEIIDSEIVLMAGTLREAFTDFLSLFPKE